MKIAIFGDIHGNDDAFEAVLTEIGRLKPDLYYCLGDLVGYGAEPGRCIAKAREYCDIVVVGNHDWAAVEKIDIEYFNPFAKEAMLWTREQLTEEERQYLGSLPLSVHGENCVLAHATLHSPELFGYIQTNYDAYFSLQVLNDPVCFLGHSHLPVTFYEENGIQYSLDTTIDLAKLGKALVNVGSVGQPRDENPDAVFAIYDPDQLTVELHRVKYDIESASAKIIQAGLPSVLAERLVCGR